MCFELHFFLFVTSLWHKDQAVIIFQRSRACFEIVVQEGLNTYVTMKCLFLWFSKLLNFVYLLYYNTTKKTKEQKKCDFSVRLLHNKTEGME